MNGHRWCLKGVGCIWRRNCIHSIKTNVKITCNFQLRRTVVTLHHLSFSPEQNAKLTLIMCVHTHTHTHTHTQTHTHTHTNAHKRTHTHTHTHTHKRTHTHTDTHTHTHTQTHTHTNTHTQLNDFIYVHIKRLYRT